MRRSYTSAPLTSLSRSFFVHPSKSIEFLMSTGRAGGSGAPRSLSSGGCSGLWRSSPIPNSLSKFDELTERTTDARNRLPAPYYAHMPSVTSNWPQNKSRGEANMSDFRYCEGGGTRGEGREFHPQRKRELNGILRNGILSPSPSLNCSINPFSCRCRLKGGCVVARTVFLV